MRCTTWLDICIETANRHYAVVMEYQELDPRMTPDNQVQVVKLNLQRLLNYRTSNMLDISFGVAYLALVLDKYSNIPITKETVRQIKTFLTDGKVPTELARSTQFKFKKRYGDGNWTLDGETLKYQGKIVVPKEDVESTLQRLYDDPLYTQQTGARLWNRISSEYAFISRSMCEAFLADKRVPQLMKRPHEMPITPINTRFPREQWNIDYVDLKNSEHANLGNRYLLNVIDHFSKYAWSFPLKSRDSDLATEKLRILFSSGHKPRVLHADNEFRAKSLIALCKQYDVKLIPSESYAPWQNGAIERFNQTIKKSVKSLQLAYDDKTFLDALDLLVKNYNRTRHSSHKMTPEEVYFTKDPEVVQKAYGKAYQYRKTRILKKSDQPMDIHAGDMVRLASSSFSSKRKSRIGTTKAYVPQFSEEIYKVQRVLQSRQEMTNPRWQIEGRSKLYYRNQLLKVPEETQNEVPEERPKFDEDFRGRTPKTRVARTTKKNIRMNPIPERATTREKSTRNRRLNKNLEDFV